MSTRATVEEYSIAITPTVSEPYYDALQSALADGNPNVIGIAGRAFLIDNASGGWLRTHINVVEQRNVGTNRDLLLLPQGVWRQTVSSWHKGSGQSNMDRDDSDPERFYKSWNINPFNKWQISCLNETNMVADLKLAVDARVHLQEVAGDLFGAGASTVFLVTDYDTWDMQTVEVSGTVYDITSDGEWFYVAHENKVTAYKNDNGTLAEAATYVAGSGPHTMVLWSKDRLFGNSGNGLYELTSGTPEEVYTHPLENYRWVDGCEGPDATYFLGGVGDKYEAHRLIVNEEGVLLTPTVAATLPEGEVGFCIEEYLGYIFIGNLVGVRMAAIQNGALTLGAIIPTNAPVYDFEGQNSFVWYTNSLITDKYEIATNNDQVFNQFPPGTSQGLGRMDLSTFGGGVLTPSYANDLIAYDQTADEPFKWPVFPWTGIDVTNMEGSITGVTTILGATIQREGISGRRVMAQAGGRIYVEMIDSPSPGWLEQGRISFSVEDTKAGLYQMAKWLPNNGTVYLDYKADGNDWFRNARVRMEGTEVSSGNLSLDGILFSRFQPRFVINPGDENSIVTRWEMRSIPAKGKASKWQVPVMNYQELDINGVKAIRDPVNELEFLMQLVESGKLFNYQESGIVYSVHATGFEWKPESLTSSGTGWQGTYTLVVEEIV